jgi:hypothetical protein
MVGEGTIVAPCAAFHLNIACLGKYFLSARINMISNDTGYENSLMNAYLARHLKYD